MLLLDNQSDRPEWGRALVLRVYLDQMAWVDLTKAALGRPRRPEHTTALEIARYGVTNELVEFPLSSIHYMETLQRKDAQSREEVGSLMVELSRMRTMAGPPDIQDEEIDRALQKRFGRPTTIRPQPVFGHGVGFAFGEKPYRYVSPPEIQVDGETRRRIEDHYSEVMERAVLAGPSAKLGIHEIPGIEHSRQIADKHAEDERQIGELIRKGGFKGARFREVWIARGLGEAVGDINRALMNAGIHPDEFAALGKEGLTQFFLDIPVLSSYWELRFMRHQNPALKWTGNDLRDLAFLCVAVVHCDVLVTERNWRHVLNRTGRPERYDTVVEADVGAITNHLLRVA